METVHIGVPVTVTVDLGSHHRLRPQWYKNYIARDKTIPTTELENSIAKIWETTKATFIFPNEQTYTMFLLKWS